MTIADQTVAIATGASLRDRIMGAAFRAFMERGYAGARTLDIARRARVSKRDLYAQFGSKHAMLAACIAERTERMRMPLDLPVPHDREALLATLTTFGGTLLREVSRPEVLATQRLAIAEAELAPELAHTLDALGRAANAAALCKVLSAAQDAGLVVAGSVEAMADTFLALLWSGGLLLRLLLRVAEAPDEAEMERRARFAVEHTMHLYAVSPVERA